VSPESTCHEVLGELLGSHLSPFTLKAVLAQLGEIASVRLAALDPAGAASLRRRLERVGRSYLQAEHAAELIRRFDALLAAANIALPPAAEKRDSVSSGIYPANPETLTTSRRMALLNPLPPPFDIAIDLGTGRRGTPPAGSPSTTSITTPIPDRGPAGPAGDLKPTPLSFPYRSEADVGVIRVSLRSILGDFLRDDSAALRLESALERTARSTLKEGGGEIRLELDAGIKGRLVFQVLGSDKKVRLSGAVLASLPAGG
jgi:hypothetical protein